MFAFESPCLEYIIFLLCINTNLVFTDWKSANSEFLLHAFMADSGQKILAFPKEENESTITHGETTDNR